MINRSKRGFVFASRTGFELLIQIDRALAFLDYAGTIASPEPTTAAFAGALTAEEGRNWSCSPTRSKTARPEPTSSPARNTFEKRQRP